MEFYKRAPKRENPELLDKVFAEVQDGLVANLPWLDFAYGRAQRIIKRINKKEYYIPAVYIDKKDYLEVSPDSNIGNFSFFTVEEPQLVRWDPKIRGSIETGYALIFWVDLRKIPGVIGRDTELVKSEILKTLNGKFRMKHGRLTVERIYEQAENIYKGFSLKEIDNQFLMHPFAGFKFTGRLYINESC